MTAWFRPDRDGPTHRVSKTTPDGATFVCGRTTKALYGTDGMPDDVCHECVAPTGRDAAAEARNAALEGLRSVFGDRLMERQVEAVTAAKLAGVTHADIGAVTGSSKSAVSNWISRNIPTERQVWR